MSPRARSISREQIVAAALGVVRRSGLAALTARSVALALETSVAPIYGAYASMDALIQDVLVAGIDLLESYTERTYCDLPFRNFGVALVVFAVDEPLLYKAVFMTEPRFARRVVTEILARLRETVMLTPELAALPPATRDELIMDLWVYTHGLASMVISGLVPKLEPPEIERKLYQIGHVVVAATVTEATASAGATPSLAPPQRPAPRRRKKMS